MKCVRSVSFLFGVELMKITILGGDLRQKELFKLLKADGNDVEIIYNDETSANDNPPDFVILPLPVSKDGIHLFAPCHNEKIKLCDIFTMYKNANFFGGQVSQSVKNMADKHKIKVCDYYESEKLLKENALLTAMAATKKISGYLESKKIMVVGFGRIGKALGKLLKENGRDFCITARKQDDLAQMSKLGYHYHETGKIKEIIKDFDIIINTVPARVLSEEELKSAKKSCVILELASPPYGTDFDYCDQNSINYTVASGLPGKYYPHEAARVIYASILNNIKSEE